MDQKTIAAKLRRGGVGVLPTDTLYGLVGSALSKKAITRMYHLKGRSAKKSFITLISSLADLRRFGVRLDAATRRVLQKIWPGKVSVVVPCPSQKFSYLHRGTKSLAFRIPKKPPLLRLLKAAGPLAAPSANLEGKMPARTIAEARGYFGARVDFYGDGGRLMGKPSTLVSLQGGKIKVLRKGAVPVSFFKKHGI